MARCTNTKNGTSDNVPFLISITDKIYSIKYPALLFGFGIFGITNHFVQLN
jgi:hypothetical protein